MRSSPGSLERRAKASLAIIVYYQEACTILLIKGIAWHNNLPDLFATSTSMFSSWHGAYIGVLGCVHWNFCWKLHTKLVINVEKKPILRFSELTRVTSKFCNYPVVDLFMDSVN